MKIHNVKSVKHIAIATALIVSTLFLSAIYMLNKWAEEAGSDEGRKQPHEIIATRNS